MRCSIPILVTFYIIVAILLQIVKSEFFTAVSDLGKLLHTEEKITRTLENYLKAEEERLTKLKRFSRKYKELYEAAKSDPELFLSNPVNAYVLVKHLSLDWNDAVNIIESLESRNILNNIISEEVIFPGKEDLSGAAMALIRLQHIYLLETETIAQGRINGTNISNELSADDCFELGREAYNSKFSAYTLKWMLETLKRLEKEEIKTVDKINVMEYIAYSAYDVGNFSLGLAVMEDIVKLNPNYPRLYDNLNYYQAKFSEWKARKNQNETKDDSPKIINLNGREYSEKELLQKYKMLCRGENMKVMTAAETNKLNCYRSTQNNPYLLLQPAKVEILNLNPRLVLFHKVISDSESKQIQETASPQLERAVVQDTITGKIEATTDRISKSVLMADDEHEVFSKISQRIEDLTGLSTKSSEPIHVINYGIGGHYEPHFDFAQASENIDVFRHLGNRIATWIFYLSEVPAGGATVFPIIGVEVKPVKGAAAFWYNLLRNGEGDKRTLHAACPVLAGSKWVSNKWLHEVGQEFRRPCSLNPLE